MVFQRKLNIMRFHHDIIRIIVLLNLYLFSNCIYADVVDSLYMALKTRSQVQEKSIFNLTIPAISREIRYGIRLIPFVQITLSLRI